MANIIEQILQNKRDEVEERKITQPLWRLREEIHQARPPKNFIGALKQRKFSIIAEIKRKSPSHNVLDADLDVLALARIYEKAEGVSCISMLTDEKHFGCTIKEMKQVSDATWKPMLRKDFVLDEYQVYEARAFGADAVLLIATLLSADELRQFVDLTFRLKMEPFVESHSLEDLKKVPEIVNVYGINTRNLLGNLETDLNLVSRLKRFVPEDKIVVGESGVKTAQDIFTLYDCGANASLTGAGIIQSPDRSSQIEKLLSLIPVAELVH